MEHHRCYLKNTLHVTLLLLSLTACKKNKDHNDSNFINATPTAVITATIDGQDFQALSNDITVVYDTLVNRYKITATPQGKKLTIELAAIQVGTYPQDFDHCLISFEKDSVTYDGGNNPEGLVEITSVQSGKFSATFSATLKNLFTAQEVSITNGIITTVPF
jgi:hypothetical protein